MVSEKRKIGIGSSCVKRRMGRHVYISLPVDVVFNILLYLPADILYNVMRYVCQEWRDVIKSPSFIASHLEKHSSTISLLIHHSLTNGYVVKARSDGPLFEVKSLNFQFLRKAWGSCNGLLFVLAPPINFCKRSPSYVVNPLTKEYLPLPIFQGYLPYTKCCFGYAAGSRLYKVMITPSYKASECNILSVGVDKAWRKIDVTYELSVCAKNLLRSSCCRVTLRGFVYWIGDSVPFILRFNMETETFDEPYVLPPYDLSDCFYNVFAMDNSLCLWGKRRSEEHLFKFWLLKDPEITGPGQWEKLIDINLNGKKLFMPYYANKPIGWLKNMELLVFCGKSEIMVYDVNTGKIHRTKDMPRIFDGNVFCQHHVQSLVPINNLSLVTGPRPPFKARSKVYSKENMSSEFDNFKMQMNW